MTSFQENVKLINNLSYKYAKTFTYNSNKVQDIFNFGESLNLKQRICLYSKTKWILWLGKFNKYLK